MRAAPDIIGEGVLEPEKSKRAAFPAGTPPVSNGIASGRSSPCCRVYLPYP